MFRSRSIAGHLIRGVLGFGFLAIVLVYGVRLGWWALAPAALALILFRGCPTCWTVGLIDTLLHHKAGAACAGGSCGTPVETAASKSRQVA